MEQQVVLLNGGRDRAVEPFVGADAYLVRLLANEPAKRAVVYLRSMQDEQGRPRIAVFVGSQLAGYLPLDIDEAVVTTVKACEIHGAVARARGSLTASWQEPGRVEVKVDLADPEHLLSNSTRPAATEPATLDRPQDPSATESSAELASVAEQSGAGPAAAMLSSSFEDAAAFMDLDEAPMTAPQPRSAPDLLDRPDSEGLSAGPSQDYPDWPPPKPKPAVTAQPVMPDQPAAAPQPDLAPHPAMVPQPAVAPQPVAPQPAVAPQTDFAAQPAVAPQPAMVPYPATAPQPAQPAPQASSQAQQSGWLASKATGPAAGASGTSFGAAAAAGGAPDDPGEGALGGARPREHGQTWQDQSPRTTGGASGFDSEIVAAWTSSAPTPRPIPQPTTVHRSSGVATTWLLASLAVLVVVGAVFIGWRLVFAQNTYTDSEYGYSFKYPNDWELRQGMPEDMDAYGSVSADDAVYVLDPNGKGTDIYGYDWIAVCIFEVGQIVDTNMITAFEPEIRSLVHGMVAQMQSRDPTLQVIEPFAQTTVAGLHGYTYMVSGTAPDGTTLTSYSLMLFYGTKEYDFILQSTSSGWNDNRKILDSLLESFAPDGDT